MASTSSKDVDPPGPVGRVQRQTDFALVIGIDHYPRFRSLQGAIADARRFHAWLCDAGGGAVQPSRARLITSTHDPAAPLQEQIDTQLSEIMTEADELGGGRRLYFYFSGHGATDLTTSSEDVAMLLANWSRAMARLALSKDGYRGKLSALGLFEEVAIFLDCCRSTSALTVGLPPTFTPQPRSPRCPTRTFLAYATEAERSAFETPDDNQWQGIFTQRLLAIFKHSRHGIEPAALKRALERDIFQGQRAHVDDGFLPGRRFGHRGILPRLEITFETTASRVRLLDGNLEEIGEHDPADGPWVLPLEVGLYTLEDGASAPRVFSHRPGEVTRVRL